MIVHRFILQEIRTIIKYFGVICRVLIKRILEQMFTFSNIYFPVRREEHPVYYETHI